MSGPPYPSYGAGGGGCSFLPLPTKVKTQTVEVPVPDYDSYYTLVKVYGNGDVTIKVNQFDQTETDNVE